MNYRALQIAALVFGSAAIGVTVYLADKVVRHENPAVHLPEHLSILMSMGLPLLLLALGRWRWRFGWVTTLALAASLPFVGFFGGVATYIAMCYLRFACEI